MFHLVLKSNQKRKEGIKYILEYKSLLDTWSYMVFFTGEGFKQVFLISRIMRDKYNGVTQWFSASNWQVEDGVHLWS